MKDYTTHRADFVSGLDEQNVANKNVENFYLKEIDGSYGHPFIEFSLNYSFFIYSIFQLFI